ncbi:MAG: hypothetical protein PHE15_00980 [Dehalococcoidales bacterium]|nr:hypothetical protein [Dehalococcoidales bacterium]
MRSQDQTGDFMQWILAMAEKINQNGRLAPTKAIQKRMQETIDIYGSTKVWEAIKQFSINLGTNNVLFMEDLFHKCPELPDLFETDKTLPPALNQWFEHHSVEVNRFHRVTSAILRANPAIEWEFDTSSDTDRDLTPIMDILFRNTEGS